MDADILRTQLRKTLGSTRGFKLEDDEDEDDDKSNSNGDEAASASSSEEEDEDAEDDDEDEDEDEDEDDNDDDEDARTPVSLAKLAPKESSDSLGDQIRARTAKKAQAGPSGLRVDQQSPPPRFNLSDHENDNNDDDGDDDDDDDGHDDDDNEESASGQFSRVSEEDDDAESTGASAAKHADGHEEDALAASPSSQTHERKIAGGETSMSGDGDDDDVEVSHASVLDAWSRQIESSFGHKQPKPKRRNRIGSNDFGDDDYYDDEFGEDNDFNVRYSSAHALPANAQAPSPQTDHDADLTPPGAQTREDLENLGKTFLRIKAETGAWLDRVLHASIFSEGGHVDATDTSTLFEALKSGVILCRVANAILPGCIPSFTSDFSSEASYKVPLSERENIKKFIRACHDAMSIPDSLLFEVGDLHNQQNIPKVVLSLRAVAEYARKFLKSPPEVHWRKLENVALTEDEDAVLMASAEMSKLDSATVYHMYAAESAAANESAGSAADADGAPEKANFENRKRSIKNNLVLNSLLQQQHQKQQQQQQFRGAGGSASGHASEPTPSPPGTFGHETASFDPASSTAGAYATSGSNNVSGSNTASSSANSSSNNSVAPPPETVEAWLAVQGMSMYYDAFIEEGWDELATLTLMSETDLRDVGIRKKGHLRKLASAIRQLKARGPAAVSETNSPSSAGGHGRTQGASPPGSPERNILRRMAGSPRGGVAAAPNMGALGTRGLHAMDRRELFNKEMAWAQCRARANVTMDLEDARAIWALLHEVRSQVSRSELSASRPVETRRAVQHLVGLTEDLVRSLMPFEAPIVIDIGWDSLKCGYVFSKAPVMLPCVVGKYSFPAPGGAASKSRSRAPRAVCSGRNVFDQCQATYGPGAGDRARQISGLGTDEGTFMIRRAIHRGIDSIVDPQVVEWDDMEMLLEHMYRDVLQAKSEQHPVLVIEPCRRWSGPERQRMAQMLTTKFNAPAIYFSPAAPLVAYKAGLKSCVVLDLGESRSTASVVYNNRLVKDAVVNSPIGGLQLTELMMQSLTQDGYDFKSVFEAQNPAQFSSTRHFLEQEMAREVKDRVCVIANSYEEFCVSPESLPAYLGDYLPRVSRGAPFLNVGEARAHVPEALFSPDLVRRDQFYNGGSLQHIIKAALERCTESVAATASETVLICGGMANLPGLAGRLQKELNELYAVQSRKPPRVMLTSDEDLDDVLANPLFTAWQGGSMLALQHEFQSRWIARETFLEKGDKVFTETSVAEGLGPFPLYSPDTALYKANRAVNSLRDLLAVLSESGAGTSSSSASSSSSALASSSMVQPDTLTPGLSSSGAVDEEDSMSVRENLSPRSLKSMINDVAIFLDEQKCPEVYVLDVKMHLYDRYSRQPPRKRLPVEEILLSLPDELLGHLEPYVSLAKAERGHRDGAPGSLRSRRGQTAKQPAAGVKQSAAQSSAIANRQHFSETSEDDGPNDDDDDDEDDGEEFFAMAI
ncbi:Actin [Hondaea fermentalgiana]|uniref:Actin n=1 Tax=Hondaea fermentalgiana TaxID=2315210 RepID=A0A2R5G2E5_9STRA|nr:Actin [Hondaea fermentalgiana]|eukprot:GBG25186.1 Actin [Hondaea fermentalgiana]